MSVRVDAGTEGLQLSAAPAGAATAMLWFNQVVDRGDAWETVFQYDLNTWIGIQGPENRYTVWDGGGTNSGSIITPGVWYHVAFVKLSDASGTALRMYLNGFLDFTRTRSAAAGTPDIRILRLNDSDWVNGNAAYAKIWNAELTEAEIRNEMPWIAPLRNANLWSWWPMLPGDTERIRDYSPFGRNLTNVGSLTDEAFDPPIGWHPHITRPHLASPALRIYRGW